MEKFFDSPIVTFTVLLLVIFTIPPIFEKLKLPGLVGLLVAGVIFGQEGFGFLNYESESIHLLGDIGKIYLMFVAGLEVDLEDFRKNRNRSLNFGFQTFFIPLVTGFLIGLFFDMGINASILLGSILSSHTLLAYPIINRLGVVNNESVMVTIGATIFTDIGALLVLAVCISIKDGNFSTTSLIVQLVSLAIYTIIVLYGFNRAGKEYFRRTGDEQSNQFLFVLLAVFLASVGAQIINVDKIIGAFLAGLAINDVVGDGPVKEKIEFVGSTLFIPCFFVATGLIINVSSFKTTLTQDLALTVSIVGGLFLSKFLATLIPKLMYKYSWNQTLTMWSLSLPQVAATLAATLAGFEAGILSESVLNGVIILMFVTALFGPILTKKFARTLIEPELIDLPNLPKSDVHLDDKKHTENNPFTVIVPISNPNQEKSLIEMGAIFAKHEKGLIIPLSIVKAHVQMDEPQLNLAIENSDQLINRALDYSQELRVTAKPVIRIDDDVAEAITRTARENNASLIVMGWSPNNTLQARLFGNLIDNVFWASHCHVAVINLLDSPSNIRRILVPIKNIDLKTLNTIRFAAMFADSNQGNLTLLHIHDPKADKNEMKIFKSTLTDSLAKISEKIDVTIKTLRYPDVATAIIHTVSKYDCDLVVLRSVRRRTVGGLAVSDITTQVIKKLNRSIILLGEPH